MKWILIITMVVAMMSLVSATPNDALWENTVEIFSFDGSINGSRLGTVGNDVNAQHVFNTTNKVLGSASTTWNGGRTSSAKFINYTDDLDSNTNFSFSYWIYPTDLSAGSLRIYILGSWAGNVGWTTAINTQTGGQLFFLPNAGQQATTDVINENVWTHIVGVYDANGDNFYYYINGTLRASDTSVGVMGDYAGGFGIGARNDPDFEMIGELDEVYLFNRTLNQTEVTWLYNDGAGQTPTDPDFVPIPESTNTYVESFYTNDYPYVLLGQNLIFNDRFEVENGIYGEMYGDEIGDADVVTQSVYVNITNMSEGDNKGVNFDNYTLEITKAGTYQVEGAISFSGGANTEYHLALGKNSVINKHCHAQRKIGTGGDVGSAGFSCIDSFDAGDIITAMIENVDSTTDPTIHGINLNIERIGI